MEQEKLLSYIKGIRDWLKNLAEDRTLPMDVKVHEELWHGIQSIDHDIETDFNDSGKFVWFFGEAPTGVYEIMFYVEDVCGVMDSVKVTFDIVTGIGTKDGLALPETYYLGQNYPNPFNPYTIIEFGLPERSAVDLAVYNLLGQKIKTLINESLPANNYVFEWDGTNDNGVKVASGVYLYKLISDNYTETKKMIMLK